MTASNPTSFSIPQRVLHWLMALLILFNLIFSDGMEHWHRLMRRGETITPDDISSANIHAYVGITVLVLAVIRLCLRFIQGVPPEPAEEPPLLKIAAKISHWAFYALFIGIPFTGIGAYYFGNNQAGSLHAGPLKMLMWVLIIVHIAAALVHQFYWKTDLLKRMTRG